MATTINLHVVYKYCFRIKFYNENEFYFATIIIILIKTIWPWDICQLNMNILQALDKSIGFYERKYSQFEPIGFNSFLVLECIDLYFI